MRWPWIARSSHDAMVRLLIEQIAELKAERVVLYDRLGAIGLGGPLFNVPEVPQDQESKEEPELVDPDEDIQRILKMSRRPSLMARAIRERAIEEINKLRSGPKVAWIPDNGAASVTAALDAAEAEGKRQA